MKPLSWINVPPPVGDQGWLPDKLRGLDMVRKVSAFIWGLGLPLAAVLVQVRPAHAIPAFAQQTGQPCAACHIGAFGPQLTPLGRAFKIGGYTQGGGDGLAAKIPLSVMIQGSFNNTGVAQNPAPQHYDTNNNYSLDQISIFLGGHIGEHVGGLMQFTWSDYDNTVVVDNMDLRPYTTTFNLGDKELRVGTTVNNNPTVQDPFNTTPAWGFPYYVSKLGPTPAASTMLSGGFSGNSVGTTAYAWYDNKLYLEGGVYNSFSPWVLARFGQDYVAGATTSPAPYLRAAYEWQWGTSDAFVGAIFMHADANPPSGVPQQATNAFGADHYTDYAFDAGYQFLGDGTHIVTAQAIYTYEDQNLNGSAGLNGIGQSHYSLNQLHVDVAYWYKNTYGLTLGWQHSWGPADPVLYAASGAMSANNNNKPDSNAFIVEADWVPFGKDDSPLAPFLNLKLGLQYTAYTEFNGGSSNYGGAGGHASDNNLLMAYAWLMF
jgi:hypothetical protein